jgi:hypothetical protein
MNALQLYMRRHLNVMALTYSPGDEITPIGMRRALATIQRALNAGYWDNINFAADGDCTNGLLDIVRGYRHSISEGLIAYCAKTRKSYVQAGPNGPRFELETILEAVQRTGYWTPKYTAAALAGLRIVMRRGFAALKRELCPRV